MPAPLRISLVTPSFNQARFIRRTIDSVLAQQGDFELDYVILDAASTDGTIEILENYGDRIRWISEPDNEQIDAINRGLRGADGDIVSFLNSDDTLLPGALARITRAFQTNPRVEWVHGRCVMIDEDDRPTRRLIALYKDYRCRNYSFPNLLTENYISEGTFWRRSVHDAIGYLDPSCELAFDYDLFVRLALRGDPIYIPDPIFCYRVYDSSKSGANAVAQLAEANAIANRYATPTPWMRARMRLKTEAIAAIYRGMGWARAARQRVRW